MQKRKVLIFVIPFLVLLTLYYLATYAADKGLLLYGKKKFSNLRNLLKNQTWNVYRVHQIGETTHSASTTVTMYFRLAHSKHGLDDFQYWQTNFFKTVTQTPLVIFTDEASIDYLTSLASRTNNSKTFFVFKSIFQITRMIEVDRNRNDYIYSYFLTQHLIDPERHIHSPSLYAIWNAKPFLMKYVSSGINNIYGSTFFIYTDIGAFRNHVFPNWPNLDHVNYLQARLKDRMLFGQVSHSVNDLFSSINNDFIQGTFFAGSFKAIDFYQNAYYQIHDEFLAEGLFVGKDQVIMNVFAVLKYPKQSCMIWLPQIVSDCLRHFNIWFFYQLYLQRSPSGQCSILPDSFFSDFRFFKANSSVISCDGTPEGALTCLPCSEN